MHIILALALLAPADTGPASFDDDLDAVVSFRSPFTGTDLVTGQGGAVTGGLLRAGSGTADPKATEWNVKARSGAEVVLTGSAHDQPAGVKGIALALRGIPDDFEAIIPATSGLHFTAATAVPEYRTEWPIGWEAGLVIFQGKGEGLLVMAEDPAYTFKGVDLRHRTGYWDLVVESCNEAPFADKTACFTVPWVLAAYQGDWRVAARRYRDFLATKVDLAAARAAQPPWVGDIRLCVTMGVEEKLLDPLAERCDPSQTILYIPSWRAHEYDRDYPDYTPAEGVKEFTDHAHRLGFKVMPHANYFGCDPKNDLYAKFAPYQLRDPNSGELLWWLWDRADPIIKFAYIHPGSAEWRRELIRRLAEAHERLGFDAVHIDQTLCIFNHAGGRVDGLNCAEGSLQLHRDLREALPDVALSGEGLDEVTFVYEAFAQRHCTGFDHTTGSWTREWLDRGHPISAYLFTPHTTNVGYLGMSSPSSDQAYAAWRHAYRWQNVIPTLTWPSESCLRRPEGFWAQGFAEARAWQEGRLVPDTEGDWPADACYPYRTADGRPAAYVDDRGTALMVGGREVTRTITGVTAVALPGTVAGWRYYDSQSLKGLDPDHWYAYDPAPRSMADLHVEQAPADAFVVVNRPDGGIGRVLVGDRAVVADLVKLLPGAECGLRQNGAVDAWQQGGLAPDAAFGATVEATSKGLAMHPAWRPDATAKPVRGDAVARFTVDVPAAAACWFQAGACLRPGAEGKSDGADFTVTATMGATTLSADALAATEKPVDLRLDLSPLAGRTVTLEVSCGDGPKDDPSFDWGLLVEPRVMCVRHGTGAVVLAGDGADGVFGAIAGPSAVAGRADAHEYTVPFPGAVYLNVPDTPADISLPCDLAALPWQVVYRTTDDRDMPDPGQFAGFGIATATCGGVEMPGFGTHPPEGGKIVLQALVRLPQAPARLVAAIGIRDGSKSDGVTFSVWVGGRELVRQHVVPGGWQDVEADLSYLAGKTTVIELVADSEGSFYYDWAAWGRPTIEAVQAR